jgi:hypothetical protein
MSDIVKFPEQRPNIPFEGPYDDDDNLRHAEHFRCLETRIVDCWRMSLFASEEMEKADDGKHPQLAFAVHHLVDMLCALKKHYEAAYKGEIEP